MKRGRTAREIPPPLELECLSVLWTIGEGNVQAVRDALAGRRQLAYTTVMTMLDRLARKQAVSRRKAGRSFIYTPAVSRETIRSLAVKELTDSLFEGSRDQLASWLNGSPAPRLAAAAESADSSADSIDDSSERLDAALL
jgi:predicted transcriptional regulator